MEVLNRRAPFFYNQLNRNVKSEYDAENTRMPSVVNTYQNIPQFQQVQNLSRNYARVGQQKFEDPFKFHARPLDEKYDGRNLQILNTLKYNAKRDYPDVKTMNPLKVIGYY
jgi:hypothetical protein